MAPLPKPQACLRSRRRCSSNAENDERINAMWPAFETALKAAGVPHEMHKYPGTQHGFHNNSTPRFDESAAKLAWTVPLRTSRSISREGRFVGRSSESSGHPKVRRHRYCCWTGQRRLPLQCRHRGRLIEIIGMHPRAAGTPAAGRQEVTSYCKRRLNAASIAWLCGGTR